ncbi:MAG: hypothetical protein SFU85_00730 [Candidatus Methylacidiphilales bacterium]|nr:hypothetical protein [Candidatus Methylacidiphilales bacterium]
MVLKFVTLLVVKSRSDVLLKVGAGLKLPAAPQVGEVPFAPSQVKVAAWMQGAKARTKVVMDATLNERERERDGDGKVFILEVFLNIVDSNNVLFVRLLSALVDVKGVECLDAPF